MHHRYQRHRWQIYHRYQQHQQQIFPPFLLALLILVVNLPPLSTIPAANLPLVSTTPVANCHRYQRHWRQICHRCKLHRRQRLGTIIKLLTTKINLKKNYLYANSTTQRCPKETIKNFLIEDFFHLPLVSLTPVATLNCEYRGGHRHLQIGRMLDIDLISEPPHSPSPQMYVSKVWESVWPEGQEAIHS